MYVETSAQIYAGFMGLFSIVVIALHLYGIARVGLNRNFHFDISRHAKVPRSTRGRGFFFFGGWVVVVAAMLREHFSFSIYFFFCPRDGESDCSSPSFA